MGEFFYEHLKFTTPQMSFLVFILFIVNLAIYFVIKNSSSVIVLVLAVLFTFINISIVFDEEIFNRTIRYDFDKIFVNEKTEVTDLRFTVLHSSYGSKKYSSLAIKNEFGDAEITVTNELYEIVTSNDSVELIITVILNNQKFAIPHFYYDVGDLKVVTFEKPLSEQKEVSIICGGGMLKVGEV